MQWPHSGSLGASARRPRQPGGLRNRKGVVGEVEEVKASARAHTHTYKHRVVGEVEEVKEEEGETEDGESREW